jgi:hypothetical protein
VTEPPFRMDPNARFDDEVARIARENNAEVAFKLVDREDGAVSTPDRPCCFDHDRSGQPAQATQVIVVESRGQHYEYESCQGHATAARMRSDSFGSQGRGEDLAEVQGHIKDTASKITSRPIDSKDRHCELHDHTRTQNADRYIFTITHPDGTVTQVVVCQEHREWINGQSRNPELRPPDHSDRKAVAELKPQLVDPKNRIAGGGRAPEQPDRGPGGGPGGRSMVPDPPAPPRKIERTYPPPSDPDGGRLVPGCFGLFETAGFHRASRSRTQMPTSSKGSSLRLRKST